MLKRLLTEGNVYDPSVLKEALIKNIGDKTFQESYNISRIILNITVSSDSLFEMPRLLNHITSPDVVSIYQCDFNNSIVVLIFYHCYNKVLWSAM